MADVHGDSWWSKQLFSLLNHFPNQNELGDFRETVCAIRDVSQGALHIASSHPLHYALLAQYKCWLSYPSLLSSAFQQLLSMATIIFQGFLPLCVTFP